MKRGILKSDQIPDEKTCDDREKSAGHQLEKTVEPDIDFVQEIRIGELRVPLKTQKFKLCQKFICQRREG